MTRAWMLVLFAGDGTSMYAKSPKCDEAERLFTADREDAKAFDTPQHAAEMLVNGFRDYLVPGRFAIVRVAREAGPAIWREVADVDDYRGVDSEGHSYHFKPGGLEKLEQYLGEWKEVAADE